MISLLDWRLCGASLHPWEKGQTLELMGFQTCLEVHRELPASSRLAFPARIFFSPGRIVSTGSAQVQAQGAAKLCAARATRLLREHDLITNSFRWRSGGFQGFCACQRYYWKVQKLKCNLKFLTWARGCFWKKKKNNKIKKYNNNAMVVLDGNLPHTTVALRFSHLTESASIIKQ